MSEHFNSTFLVLNFLDPSWNISGSELCQKSLFFQKKTKKSCETLDKSQILFCFVGHDGNG